MMTTTTTTTKQQQPPKICVAYIFILVLYIYYVSIHTCKVNQCLKTCKDVRPTFFSWPFRFAPEAEPMEQQPQIGTLQQAGCAACPNQWGIGCKNTIYIYIVYSIYVYTGWTWMDWIAMWSSYWSYTKWYHFDVYCFGAFDEFAAGDSQRLTYADLHHPQGLQETGIIRWRKPWSVGLLCAAVCTYIYTYVYIYMIYIYMIYIWYI